MHRAAWFADHEPGALGARASIAFVQAAEAAEQAGTVAIHTQGGFGFTLESDVQLFFRRAKGWALVARRPARRAATSRRAPGRRVRIRRRRTLVNFSPVPLDADTLEFWGEVRAFFDEHVTDEVHERERRTGGGFDEDLHLALGERGWVAPTWPASEGGAGLDAVRAAIVAPGVHAIRGAGDPGRARRSFPRSPIRNHGGEQLQREVLPGIANGTIRVCLGYTEPDAGSDLAAVRTRAVRDGDEWILNGQKMFTTGAQFCQYSFCLTRTNPDVAKHKGLTVFLVPLDLPGIEIRGIGTVGGERTNFVHYDDVRVPDHFRLGAVDAGWSVVSEPLAQEHGIGRGDELAIEPPGSYVNTTRRLLAAVVDGATRRGRRRGTAAARGSLGARAARPGRRRHRSDRREHRDRWRASSRPRRSNATPPTCSSWSARRVCCRTARRVR